MHTIVCRKRSHSDLIVNGSQEIFRGLLLTRCRRLQAQIRGQRQLAREFLPRRGTVFRGVAGLMFGPEVNAAIRKHALEAWPDECCGVVTAEGYTPMLNVSSHPHDHFRMDSAALHGIEVLGYVHSHVDVSEAPSEFDMQQQIATAKPWGIVAIHQGGNVSMPVWWGDGVPKADLIGRRFVHGIFDCYSLIRDYYWSKNITLPEVPRGDGWWWQGKNLYRDLFPEAGFVRIDADKIQPGDVFLAQVAGSSVLNHGGILLEQNIILHHVHSKLSCRTAGGHWLWKPSNWWLRHKSRL